MEIGRCYTFGLLFLIPNEVFGCFIELHDSLYRPIDDRVVKYSDNLVDNYMVENCDYFPILWASASSSLRLTTNNWESFHSNFNQSFYKESPSIITLVNVLINKVQTEVYVKLITTQ